MVKLNKIYTKSGDDGTTGLVGGRRVAKDNVRVEAYGTVDEANSFIGAAVVIATGALSPPPHDTRTASRIAETLSSIQHDLFDLGADLATPVARDEKPSSALRITEHQVARLEKIIDDYNEKLQPLNSFVLPGGTPLSASLHVARVATRRAERCAVSLMQLEPQETSAVAIRYLNRLSDLLFVLARVANDFGRLDVLWKPGASRES